MSKKLIIPSVNIRYKLVDLFHAYMERYYKAKKSHKSHCCNMYDWMDDMDDDEIAYWRSQGFVFDECIYPSDEDDDEGDVIWPPYPRSDGKKNKHKDKDAYDVFWEGQVHKSKKKHKRGGKRARLIDISTPYSGDEENPLELGDDEIFTDYVEVNADDNGIMDGKEIYYYPDYHDKENRLEFSTLKGFNDFCETNGYSIPKYVSTKLIYNRVVHTCLRHDGVQYGVHEIMAETSYGSLFYEVCEDSELSD